MISAESIISWYTTVKIYIKDFLFALADKNLTFYDVVAPLSSKRGQAICRVAFVEAKDKIRIFTGEASGDIVEPKGELDHGKVSFNKIFKPDGSEKTYGQMSMAEHALCSARSDALRKLILVL